MGGQVLHADADAGDASRSPTEEAATRASTLDPLPDLGSRFS